MRVALGLEYDGTAYNGWQRQRTGEGVRVAALACGTRYIHTVTESIDKSDLQAAVDLLSAWLPTVK